LVKNKLSNNFEFENVFYKGQKRESQYLKIFILKNPYQLNRLGVVIKKEVGIAVKRNKIKRQLKSSFYQLDKQFIQGYDIIIFVKKKAVYLKYIDFYNEVKNLLKNLSLE
jgi:ribonuclease P protein component